MVRKIFYFLQKEVGGLHQAAYLLAVFAFFSLVLALVRDRLLAHFFGASQELDIYYAAFRIPDFIFVTAGSLVSLSILVPLLVEKSGKDPLEEKALINSLFTFFSLLIVTVSIVAFILIPFLVPIIFPGFDPNLIPRLVFLSRLLLLSPILLGFSNLFGSIAQAHRRFFVYAIAPTLYNLGIIIGALFSSMYGIVGVGMGVILGSFLHMVIQIPVIIRYNLLPTLSFNFSSVRRILLLSLPRTFTLSISHLSTLFLIAFASLQTAGSISVFSFSFNLQSVPLSIIGVSYSLAAFPTLARFFSEGKHKEFLNEVLTGARHIIFWSVPVAVLFIVLRAQIVRVIFGSGEFDWSDTRLTAAALALFAISCFFQSLTLLFVRGYYSAGQTLKPLSLNLLGGISTVFFAYFFTNIFTTHSFFRSFVESLLRVEGIPGTEVLMLPLAYSLGTLLTGLLLWVFFERDFGKFSKDLVVTFFHSFSASVIMGFYAYLSLNFLSQFLNLDTFVGIFLQGLLAGITGIIIGVFVLQLLKNRELKEVASALRQKIWKIRAVSPDTDLVQGL